MRARKSPATRDRYGAKGSSRRQALSSCEVYQNGIATRQQAANARRCQTDLETAQDRLVDALCRMIDRDDDGRRWTPACLDLARQLMHLCGELATIKEAHATLMAEQNADSAARVVSAHPTTGGAHEHGDH